MLSIRGKVPRRRSFRRVPWWLMVPALMILVVWVIWPILLSFYVAMTNLNVFYLANWISAPFVGLQNFAAVFNSHNAIGSGFVRSLEEALIFTISAIAIGLPLGVLAAMAMNRPFRGRVGLRVLFLVPYAIPIFVSGLVWRLMFLQRVGLVDRLLALVIPTKINMFWLIGPQAMIAMIVANVWSSWPFFYLFTLGALQGISPQLYEAGELDGANGTKLFWRITLPLIARPLMIATILSFIYHFNNVTTPYVLFGTTPPSSVDTLPLNIYLFGFSDSLFGSASAMSVISMMILIIPVIFWLRMRKGSQ